MRGARAARAALATAAAAYALAAGCAPSETARPAGVPPTGIAPPPPDGGAGSNAPTADASGPLADGSAGSGAGSGANAFDAGAHEVSSALPAPSFGANEPAAPSAAHAFRLAAALRATRASPSGVKVLKVLSSMPAVVDARARTGVDPFADGEWLLVYGTKVAVPGPNANVLKHERPENAVSGAIADAGLEAFDDGGAVRSEIYGVRDVLLRPRAGVMALVPADRAAELASLLRAPFDTGLKRGELARVLVAEPSKVVAFLPAAIVNASVIVKPAPDGGFDATAEADCPDAASCKTLAAGLDELARRYNTLMVRIVLKNLLASVAVHAEGAKLKASVHATPEQVAAILNILRAELGLRGEAASEPPHP